MTTHFRDMHLYVYSLYSKIICLKKFWQKLISRTYTNAECFRKTSLRQAVSAFKLHKIHM